MPDPDKTTPANPNPGEGGDKKINLDEYVPKDEVSKVVGAKESEVANLKKSLDEAQEKLLSPEYIQYLSAKKGSKNDDADKTDKSAVPKDVADRINGLEMAISNMAAVLELNDVRSRYSDFDKHRDKVEALLKGPGSNLSFEQAYLVVKSQETGSKSTPDDDETKKAKEALKGSEKPTAYAFDQQTQDKEFKSTADASADAIQQVKDRFGITGDMI